MPPSDTKKTFGIIIGVIILILIGVVIYNSRSKKVVAEVAKASSAGNEEVIKKLYFLI